MTPRRSSNYYQISECRKVYLCPNGLFANRHCSSWKTEQMLGWGIIEFNCSTDYFNPTKVFFFQIDFGPNQVLLPTCLDPTWPSANEAEGRKEFVRLKSINTCWMPPKSKAPCFVPQRDTKINEAQPCSQPCQGATAVRNRSPPCWLKERTTLQDSNRPTHENGNQSETVGEWKLPVTGSQKPCGLSDQTHGLSYLWFSHVQPASFCIHRPP